MGGNETQQRTWEGLYICKILPAHTRRSRRVRLVQVLRVGKLKQVRKEIEMQARTRKESSERFRGTRNDTEHRARHEPPLSCVALADVSRRWAVLIFAHATYFDATQLNSTQLKSIANIAHEDIDIVVVSHVYA
jgi:hypothetical protein